MKTIVFFLEEPSAQEMLEGVLSRILPPDVKPRYLIFQGKQDLEKNLVKKLRGWQLPESVFVVMRDQDSGDCVSIKQKLARLCQESGKKNVLVRVACHELESFYLGDLQAVEKGLGLRGISSHQDKSKFRKPDELGNPSEELEKLTKNNYQKVAGSRAIAPYLNLAGNRSESFNVLVSGIRRLVGAEA
jgi:hypothetical protein